MGPRICIVTNEIFGPHKNGGIGTSQTFLAIALSETGYSVDVLYTGHIYHRSESHWIKWYARFGINFLHLKTAVRRIEPSELSLSHEIYEFLKGHNYRVVVFQDWGGDGYATTCAKRVGEFAEVQLVTWLHSPEAWCMYANQVRPTWLGQTIACERERIAVEQSDYVLSPSDYMIRWVLGQGWSIGEKAQKLPLYIPNVHLSEDASDPIKQRGSGSRTVIRSQSKRGLGAPRRIVFFGRLEMRKGVELFADALALLRKEHRIGDVVFLGREASHTVEDIIERSGVDRHLVQHFGDMNSSQAIDYLVENDPIVVVPSLVDNSPCVVYECLNNGLTVITTENGGMSELISPEDRPLHIVPPRPKQLADAIARHMDGSTRIAPPRPSDDLRDVRKKTIEFFEQITRSHVPAAVSAPAGVEDVTVVLTHYERPHLLMGALESLSRQTHLGFKVIVVDDCSTSDRAKQRLLEIERAEFPFDLKVIAKSENRYLGAARNTGLESVKTPYVIFIDDDNIAMPHMVYSLRQCIKASAADVVTVLMVSFDDGDAIKVQDVRHYQHWAFMPKALSLAMVRNTFGDATAIYKADAIREVGGFHEHHGITHEDWQLHLKLAVSGKKHEYFPNPVFWYRGSADSMIRTTSRFRNDDQQIEAWEKLLPPAARAVVPLIVGLEGAKSKLDAEVERLKRELHDQALRAGRDELAAKAQLKRISAILRSQKILIDP